MIYYVPVTLFEEIARNTASPRILVRENNQLAVMTFAGEITLIPVDDSLFFVDEIEDLQKNVVARLEDAKRKKEKEYVIRTIKKLEEQLKKLEN